jgi:choline dehydrogenase-like flavoprotein
MHTVDRPPLANNWNQRCPDGYDVVVVGSGYGGAITAARLATTQWADPKPTVCILERGKEWLPGQFPDALREGTESRAAQENFQGANAFLKKICLYKVEEQNSRICQIDIGGVEYE